MIKHVVMWKLQPFAEAGPAEANAGRIKEDLEGLKGKIPGIRSLEVGINTIHSRDSFDVVLIAEFDDKDALEAYQEHPAHVKISDYISKVRLLRKVVDYEF